MDELRKEDVIESLKKVIDPELGFNIVDLGFVSDISIDNKNKKINVKLVLTTPLCPLASYVFSLIENKLSEEYEGYEVSVDYDFDTQWSPERVSPEIRKKLGL